MMSIPAHPLTVWFSTKKCVFFFFACSPGLRLIFVRSDSELQIYIFRCEEGIGLMPSDIAKSDGIKSDLSPMTQVVRFWLKI